MQCASISSTVSNRFISSYLYGGHSKGTFVEEGRGFIEKRTKTNRGRVVLACVYVGFFIKNVEIFIMKFYSYSPVFPIDYNDSMKY